MSSRLEQLAITVKLEEVAHAINTGDSSAIRALIKSRSIDANVSLLPVYGAPPALVLAAECGQAAIVRLLLKAGANVDIVDSSGRSACYVAAVRGHVDVVARLLKRRANLAQACSSGHTPLDEAIRMCRVAVIVLLILAGAPLTNRDALCRAAALSTAVIQALADRGVVISELRDNSLQTPLHNVDKFDPAALRMLVNVCGVDVNARDAHGDTCCHTAVRANNDDLVHWLIVNGANVDLANDDGETPLILSCASGRVACLILLVAACANVHTRCNSDKSALYWTAFSGRRRPETALAFAALLAGGADRDTAVIVLDKFHINIDLDNSDEIENARRRIARVRFTFVRERALQVCVGLQSRGLDALQTCEILMHACDGRFVPFIAFHQWWAIATTVKHFFSRDLSSSRARETSSHAKWTS